MPCRGDQGCNHRDRRRLAMIELKVMNAATGEVVFLGEIDDVEEVYDIISEYGRNR